MTQQPRRDEEELVEEIAKFVVALFEQGYAECLKTHGHRIPMKPRYPELVEGKSDREITQNIITLISQAIAEGKVRVAGEKARWPNDYQTIWDFTNTALETGCELIALRKEGTGPLTGTGREEEA